MLTYTTKGGKSAKFNKYERDKDSYIVHICARCKRAYQNVLRYEMLIPEEYEGICSVDGCASLGCGWTIDFLPSEVVCNE